MCTPPVFSAGVPSGMELGHREEIFRVQQSVDLTFLWAPAVPLAKRDSPSVPIPAFRGNFMLRISVLALAILFLVGCGGGSMPFTPPHSGTSGGTASSSGSSGSGSSSNGIVRQRLIRAAESSGSGSLPAAVPLAAAPQLRNFRQQFFRQRLLQQLRLIRRTFWSDRPQFIYIFGL